MSLHQTARPIVFGPPGNSPYPLADAAPPVLRSITEPVTAVRQVETATAAGTASATGTAVLTVTSALFTTPEVVNVAITNGDTATVAGGKFRAALLANDNINQNFIVGGSTTAVTLSPRKNAPNDSTLNIAIATGSATGVTAAATSANTTAGVEGTEGILGQEIIYITSAGAFQNAYKLVNDDPISWRAMVFVS